MSSNVIAIDGPAYVGKSQISKCLAELTGYSFMNTGHMYRSVARVALENKISCDNPRAISNLAKNLDIQFVSGKTLVNGQDWTEQLDYAEIVRFASQIAAITELREVLTQMQRAYAQSSTIIMEGRDIGSVVFPDALWKFFVTASTEVRARRMYKMLNAEEKKKYSDFQRLIPKVEELDDRDRTREIAPLVQAADAIVYDNSDSPTAMQDAQILHYYITHPNEIIENSKKIGEKFILGKHR